MTERCSSLVHVVSGASIFTLLLRRRIAFLHRTAICRRLFKPSVSFLSTYKTIGLCLGLLSQFFIWLSLVRPLSEVWLSALRISGKSHLPNGIAWISPIPSHRNRSSNLDSTSWNVVLEKDGKDQLDRSLEKWRSITYSQGAQEYTTRNK